MSKGCQKRQVTRPELDRFFEEYVRNDKDPDYAEIQPRQEKLYVNIPSGRPSAPPPPVEYSNVESIPSPSYSNLTGNVDEMANVVTSLDIKAPKTYQQATTSDDQEFWKKAIDLELAPCEQYLVDSGSQDR